MSTPNVPSELLNEVFAARLDNPSEKKKIAAMGADFIRDRLRESSFARQIVPPRQVTRAELQVSMLHDTLVKVVELEPESKAMTVSFRGDPDTRYYQGDRLEVPFFQISSERFEQTEEELAAYTMPITEIIRKNSVRDIEEIEDYNWLTHCESAVQALQKEANSLAFTASFGTTTACTAFNINAGTCTEVGKIKANDVLFQTTGAGAAATATAGLTQDVLVPVQKDDMTKLFQLFPGRGATASRLRADRFLITDTDYEDINNWSLSEVGDDIAGETTVDGFKYKSLVGRKYVRTLKTDVLRPGNIYCFAAPQFFGGFYLWNKTKFFADKEVNRVSFQAWETIAMYIANIAGVRKLELYAGSVDEGVSGVQSDYAPVSEKSLGRKNNRVEEGAFFPEVSGF